VSFDEDCDGLCVVVVFAEVWSFFKREFYSGHTFSLGNLWKIFGKIVKIIVNWSK
jgi:hypothetical protein